MGGASTAIYPVATPGGYQIFARIPVPIWDTEQRFPEFRDEHLPVPPGRPREVRARAASRNSSRSRRRCKDGSYVYNVVDYQRFSVRNYKKWVKSLEQERPVLGGGHVRRDLKPGLETSIQDYPGRIGFWNQGFPPSGPMDSWSFRLANLLVGNPAGAAGLEGPVHGADAEVPRRDGVIAICRRRHAGEARRPAGAAVGEHRRQSRPDAGADVRGQARRARLYRLRRRHRHAAVAGLALDLPQGRRRRHGRPCAEDRAESCPSAPRRRARPAAR